MVDVVVDALDNRGVKSRLGDGDLSELATHDVLTIRVPTFPCYHQPLPI